MLNFKRVVRCVISLALCAVLVVAPVEVMALRTPASSTFVPQVSGVPMEAPKGETQGHLVSTVRRSRDFSGTVIGCLEDGTRIHVLKTYGEFYQIDCFDMKGYIAKSQVAVNEQGEYYVKCDPESKESKYLPAFAPQEALLLKSRLRDVSDDYLGVRYTWGGTTPKGFDCSGYTQYIMDLVGITINRTALTQLQDGVVIAKKDLQCGDLVFFSNTSGRGFASHVAMYIGNGKIIHSGASTGVVIADLNSNYYTEHYLCARRIVLSDIAVTAAIPNTLITQGGVGSQWRDTGSTGLGLIGQ